MSIVSVEVRSFEVAVLRALDSSLRQRPVAVVATAGDRMRVKEVSAEAYEEGVRLHMTVDAARRLCPPLRIVPSAPDRTHGAHRIIQHVASRFAPVFETVRPGHIFLDLTGTQRLFGSPIDTAVRLEREIHEQSRLGSVVGVGRNKLVSHVAAGIVEPLELYEVRTGGEEAFLAPMSLSVLEPVRAFTPQCLTILDDLNLRTLGAVASVPLPHLELAVGPAAALLHEWAHGIDRSPVLPVVEQPTLERVLSFVPPEIDDERLLGALFGLLEQIAATLRRQKRACGRLHLMIRYSDRVDVSRRQRIDPPSCWEAELYPLLRTLLRQVFQRRVRIHAVRLCAEDLVEQATLPGRQLLLFDEEPAGHVERLDRTRRLTHALDRIRDRFGEDAITWARTRPSLRTETP